MILMTINIGLNWQTNLSHMTKQKTIALMK